MEIIKINDCQIIECDFEFVSLTIGDYEGYYVREDQTTILESGECCLYHEAYEIGGKYYHEYEFDSEGIIFDHYREDYEFKTNCYYGYISINEKGYFHCDADYIYFNDEYYFNSYLASEFGIEYCYECSEYYSEDNGCQCSNKFCFEYHSDNREDYSKGSIYKIGFEIEKEDFDILKNDYAIDLYNDTGWAKEKDGSLGSDGFELISPILPFDLEVPAEEQLTLIESICIVKDYINAEFSCNCGGHINISKNGLSSFDLLSSISGYLPLFYSIYQNRLNNRYAQSKSLNSYLNYAGKYSSFFCKDDGILEIRIFPAVKNISNLFWRTDLLRLILANPTNSYKKALEQIANPTNALHQHLRKIFTPKELLTKVKLFAKYVKQFEDFDFKQRTINRSLVKILKVA